MIRCGEQRRYDDAKPDYFEVSLPTFGVLDDDLKLRNRIHCHYMMALGWLGLGNRPAAEAQFEAVPKMDASLQGAQMTL